jgi:hypothetical protein
LKSLINRPAQTSDTNLPNPPKSRHCLFNPFPSGSALFHLN